ncbi:hypothetical protein GCM10022254_02910 [Actinomadura meridiana]|uniref:Flavin reductase like domain-containing protein n=1 Tax=Actinomadura meridiana TaxID=559626 RepID=A0ABP8BRY6_9ACTN
MQVGSETWPPRLRPVAGQRGLRDVFGNFPSGVVGLCALDPDGSVAGMAVSSFTSVSLDPPLVSVCVADSSRTWQRVRGARTVGLSVLGERDGALCRALAGPADSRFDGVDWTAGDGDAVFLRGAVAWLECAVAAVVPAGDHVIVLLEVRAASTVPWERPLVFQGGRFWTLSEGGGRLVDRLDGALLDEMVGLAQHGDVARVLALPRWQVWRTG